LAAQTRGSVEFFFLLSVEDVAGLPGMGGMEVRMQENPDTLRAWHQYPIVWLGLGAICFVLALMRINLVFGPMALGEVRPTRFTFEEIISHNVSGQKHYVVVEGYLNTEYYVYEDSGNGWPRWYLLFAPGDTASYLAPILPVQPSQAEGDRPALIVKFRSKATLESFSESSVWSGTLQKVDRDVPSRFRPGQRAGLHLREYVNLLPLQLSDQMLMVGERPDNTSAFVLLGMAALSLLQARRSHLVRT